MENVNHFLTKKYSGTFCPEASGLFTPHMSSDKKIITSRKTLIVRVKFIFRIKVTIANDIFIMQYIKIYFKFNPKNTFLW